MVWIKKILKTTLKLLCFHKGIDELYSTPWLPEAHGPGPHAEDDTDHEADHGQPVRQVPQRQPE